MCRKIIIAGCLLFLTTSIASFIPTASAQTTPDEFPNQLPETIEYTPLAPLPGTTEGGKATLQSYLPGLFKLVIGLAAVLAVGWIIWGGIEYITTDAISGKEEGKKRIQNAVIGLVIVITSYLILNTINHNLLELNLGLEPTTVGGGGAGGGGGPTGGGGEGGDAAARAKVTQDCPGCTLNAVQINLSSSDIARLSCTTCTKLSTSLQFGGNTQMNGTPELNDKLVALKNSTGGTTWGVSEAYPPVVHHADNCHFNGTCIDAVVPGINSSTVSAASAAQINAFMDKARNANLRPVFEVKTQAEVDQWAAVGVSAIPVGWATGTHFSIYSN